MYSLHTKKPCKICHGTGKILDKLNIASCISCQGKGYMIVKKCTVRFLKDK